MTGHGRNTCPRCGQVRQCRCIGPKAETREICNACVESMVRAQSQNGHSICDADGCQERVRCEVHWPGCPPVGFCGMHTSYAEQLAERDGVKIVILPVFGLAEKPSC